MAAFDEILEGSGQDKMQQLVDKYDATMAALKAGTLNQLLAGNGAGSAPTYKDVWTSFVVVGVTGGAPAYASNFQQSGGGTDYLRYRKSAILDTVEITGRFERITTSLTDGNSATVFTLPAGFIPARAQFVAVRSSVNFEVLEIIIAPTTGIVTLANGTGNTMTAGTFFDITLRFPLT